LRQIVHQRPHRLTSDEQRITLRVYTIIGDATPNRPTPRTRSRLPINRTLHARQLLLRRRFGNWWERRRRREL